LSAAAMSGNWRRKRARRGADQQASKGNR
jgi:hypothetical protein